jgi:SOS response regulatory protein OraA/RecX
MDAVQGDAFNAALDSALKALKQRPRFSEEIRELLRKKQVSGDIATAVLAHLERRRFVDDEATIEACLQSFRGKKLQGPEKVRALLLSRGAPADLVESALASHQTDASELIALLDKHFKQGASAAKAARLLSSRGFDEEGIEESLSQWSGLLDG